MAKYDLPAPKSMYRDLGHKEIAGFLRKRYVDNLKADDAIAQAILEMDSLEQDNETKLKLIDKYNTKLGERAALGNYEMQGTAIQKDARNFLNDYHPISTSLKNYQTMSANLDKAVTSKQLKSTTAQRLKEKAKYKYKGIQFGLDGKYDPESIFQGLSYVHDVDYNALIIDEMKGLKPTITDNRGIEVPLDENAQLIQITENNIPAYYLKQGEYKEQIDANFVQEVVNSVLNREEVDSSIRQEVDLHNYLKDEIDPNTEKLKATKEVNERIIQIGAEIDRLAEKKDKTTTDKNKLEYFEEYEAMLNEQRNLMSDYDLLNIIGTIDKKNEILRVNLMKYAGPSKHIVEQEYTEGARFNIQYKSIKDNPASLDTYVSADQLVVDVFGGKTQKSKTKFKNEAEAILMSLTTQYGGEELGAEFILAASNANTPEEIDKLKIEFAHIPEVDALSHIKLLEVIGEVQASQRTINFITKQIEQATLEALNTDPETYDANISAEFIEKSYSSDHGNVTGSDVLNSLVALNIVPKDATMKEAIDALRAAGTKPVGGSAYGGVVSQNVLASKIANNILETRNIDPEAAGKTSWGTNVNTEDLSNVVGQLLQDYSNRTQKDNESIDAILDKEIKTDALLLNSYGDKTGNTAKAFKTYFSSKRVDKNMLFSHEGAEISFEQLEEELGPLEILPEQSGLLAVSRPDGQPLLLFKFKDKDGVVHGKTTPASSISNQVIRDYVSTNKYKVESLYLQGLQADFTTTETDPESGAWTPPQFGGLVTFNYNKDASKNTIEIYGNVHTIPDGLEVLSQLVEKKGIHIF